MKISVDINGTFDAQPEFFRCLFKGLQAAGHEVGILTGHNDTSEEHDRDKLASYGVFPDFYYGRTPQFQPMNGSHFKCAMILGKGIDLHFEDMDYANPESIEIFRNSEANGRVVLMPNVQPGRWDR